MHISANLYVSGKALGKAKRHLQERGEKGKISTFRNKDIFWTIQCAVFCCTLYYIVIFCIQWLASGLREGRPGHTAELGSRRSFGRWAEGRGAEGSQSLGITWQCGVCISHHVITMSSSWHHHGITMSPPCHVDLKQETNRVQSCTKCATSRCDRWQCVLWCFYVYYEPKS